MKKGSIPEKITIISSGEMSVLGSEVKVIPAYVADSLSKNSIESGRNWAKYSRRYNTSSAGDLKEEERDNIPFSNLIITGLDYRGEGGRAYKVKTSDNYYFDFREDVLIDVIKNSEIIKGEIKGEFIWGKVGSQMKIVKVGSGLYDGLVRGTEKSKLNPIKSNNLKVGGLYESKSGLKSIFLGFISTISIYRTPSYYGVSSDNVTYYVKKIPKIMLWFKYNSWYKDTPLKKINDILFEDSGFF